MMMLSVYFLLILGFSQSGNAGSSSTTEQTGEEAENLGETRRIIGGSSVFDTRPYMIYLRPATVTLVDQNWLCGGVILDPHYILTSAACIEDIKQFYVISGTHKWLPPDQTNACIRNGAMRAIWKCVPRSYRYDGTSFNNIRWMVNDIAVVMTEESISFTKRVKGCDFIPNKINYNNFSQEWEAPGTRGFIAGWGSENEFTDPADIIANTRVNTPVLMEGETIIINKNTCKQRWLPRYHKIIDLYMICGKQATKQLISPNCDNHADCRQLVFSEEVGPRTRRLEREPEKLLVDSAAQVQRMERTRKIKSRRMVMTERNYTGFCEDECTRDEFAPYTAGRETAHAKLMPHAPTERQFCAASVGRGSGRRLDQRQTDTHVVRIYTSDCTRVLRDASTILEEESFDWGNMPFRSRAIYESDDDEPVLRTGNNTVTETTNENVTTNGNTTSEG